MMASGFRVRVTGLVFKLASLVLKQVPICISKPQANTFDKSIVFNIGHFWSIQMVLSHFRWFLVGFRLFQVVLNCFSSFLTLVSTGLGHFRLFQLILLIVLARYRWFQLVLDGFRLFHLIPRMVLAHFRWFQVVLECFSLFLR